MIKKITFARACKLVKPYLHKMYLIGFENGLMVVKVSEKERKDLIRKEKKRLKYLKK